MAYVAIALFDLIVELVSKSPRITIQQLSMLTHVSRRTIQNVVTVKTGSGFRQLQQRVLIRELERLILANPTCAIKELAFGVGYNSPRSFARALRRAIGLTPTEFRALSVKENAAYPKTQKILNQDFAGHRCLKQRVRRGFFVDTETGLEQGETHVR